MKRLLGAMSVAFAIGCLAAPSGALAQSSGAPPGCAGTSCNPYFFTYFPSTSWPQMSWLDRYNPGAAPPGNGCMPYLPGQPLGTTATYYCQRGQGVTTSRYSPAVHQQVLSFVYDIPAASGAGYFMTAALVTGALPPQGTDQANSGWPGNQLYGAGSYSLDCSQGTGYHIANWGSGFDAYSCVMNAAPVMDFSEIKTKLENAGYVWYVSYPFHDAGNGRAVVTYARYGAYCPGVSISPPPWWTIPQSYPTRAYYNMATGNGGNYACEQGYARVTNAGWVNQFDYSGAVCSGYGWTNGVYGCIYDNFQYGDYLGEYFATLDGGSQQKALRLVVPVSGAGPYFNQTSPAGAFLAPIIDPWVGEPPPPPVVLTPPTAPPPSNPADPTNVGQPSVPAGSGTPGSGTTGPDGGAFDWNAYCHMPNPDGTPRTDAWIANCLATPH